MLGGSSVRVLLALQVLKLLCLCPQSQMPRNQKANFLTTKIPLWTVLDQKVHWPILVWFKVNFVHSRTPATSSLPLVPTPFPFFCLFEPLFRFDFICILQRFQAGWLWDRQLSFFLQPWSHSVQPWTCRVELSNFHEFSNSRFLPLGAYNNQIGDLWRPVVYFKISKACRKVFI